MVMMVVTARFQNVLKLERLQRGKGGRRQGAGPMEFPDSRRWPQMCPIENVVVRIVMIRRVVL